MTELENNNESTPEPTLVVNETVSLLFEFEFSEFREIFSTLQNFTDSGITYKVVVAESRDTGFPILELTGDKEVVHTELEKLGYSKDMLVLEEQLESEEDIDEDIEEDDIE